MRPESAVWIIMRGWRLSGECRERARDVFDPPIRRSFQEFVELLERHGAVREYSTKRDVDRAFLAPAWYRRGGFGRPDKVVWAWWQHADGPGGLCLRICPAAWRLQMRSLAEEGSWYRAFQMAPLSWAALRHAAATRDARRFFDLLDMAEEMADLLVVAE